MVSKTNRLLYFMLIKLKNNFKKSLATIMFYDDKRQRKLSKMGIIFPCNFTAVFFLFAGKFQSNSVSLCPAFYFCVFIDV